MSLKSSFQRFTEARQQVAEFQSLKEDLERLLCEVVKIETYVSIEIHRCLRCQNNKIVTKENVCME